MLFFVFYGNLIINIIQYDFIYFIIISFPQFVSADNIFVS